jgi:GLPGLI family protein
MLKFLITSFTLLTSFSLNAQNLNIIYDLPSSETPYKEILSINDSTTFYFPILDDPTSEPSSFVIKNKNSGIFYVKFKVDHQNFYFSDTANLMHWQLTEDTLTLLGHLCYSAKTSFRGRNFIAYYTPDIPLDDGPWKFSGLPGLILYAASENKQFVWVAEKIESDASTKNLFAPNELLQKNYLTWLEFQQKYIEYVDIKIKKLQSTKPEGITVRMKVEHAEIIYPKYNTGSGIEY